MSKHTPGPWFSGNGNMPFNRVIKSQAGDLIAKAGDVCVGDVEANARLISAAPELLAALKEIVEAQKGGYLGWGHIDAASAAIAKATGA